jgi:nucleoside-diphosphate-sugar epimerase
MMVHVIGANGRSGAALCRSLRDDDVGLVPLVREYARWKATGLGGLPRVADLTGDDLGPALADAKLIVSCAHARYIPALLAAAPPAAVLIALGSTRKFTRWPDEHGNGVLEGERALLASGRSGVILHPTMIYGAAGEDNVQRLAALMRRLPAVPLPGGGRALVQPIHQSDVTRSIRAALNVAWNGPQSMVIAGPTALPYADFVRAVAVAAGLGRPRIVPVPAWLLFALSPLTRLPMVPSVETAEIRRLLEDKAFEVETMRSSLGVEPIPLDAGLALTFGKS